MMEKEPSFSCVSSDMPVDEEEEVRSDSSCSFFGVWGDFLQHSFQSLTHTEQMEGSMIQTIRSLSSSPSSDYANPVYPGRIRSFSEMNRREFVKHLQEDMRRRDFMGHVVVGASPTDSSTVGTIPSQASDASSTATPPKPPPQSPTCVRDYDQEDRLATAEIHDSPHLLPDDVGRKVIIVRTGHRRKSSFHVDDDDLDDETWF